MSAKHTAGPSLEPCAHPVVMRAAAADSAKMNAREPVSSITSSALAAAVTPGVCGIKRRSNSNTLINVAHDAGRFPDVGHRAAPGFPAIKRQRTTCEIAGPVPDDSPPTSPDSYMLELDRSLNQQGDQGLWDQTDHM